MNQNYYYQDGDQVCGPYDVAAIRSLQRQKKITPDTLVCPEGSEDWQPLYQYQELCVAVPGQMVARPRTPQSPSAASSSARSSAAAAPASDEVPSIARAVRFIGFLTIICGALLVFVGVITGAGVALLLSAILGTAITALLYFSLSTLLTWVYNIKLMVQKQARQRR